MAADEIGIVDGLRVTSAARTILDLSTVATPRELERALAAGERARLTSCDEILSFLNRYPRHRGTRRLRELIQRGEPLLTRSVAEDRLIDLVRAGGLPDPVRAVARTIAGRYQRPCAIRGCSDRSAPLVDCTLAGR